MIREVSRADDRVFRLALVQMRVEPDARDRNLARAVARIETAARAGADVVLLPEALPLGWMAAGSRDLADEVPAGPTCAIFREAARRVGVYICTGLVERCGNRVFNAAVLIDGTGRICLHHRKVNELAIAGECYDRGDRLQVVRTPWGVWGLMICADAFAPGQVISRTLGLMGAEVILSPCAWAVPPDHDNQRDPYGKLWRDNYGPVARDFHLWIAGVSNVGRIGNGAWRGHGCIGCSLVVDPSGSPVVEGPYGVDAEVVLYVDITPGGGETDVRRRPEVGGRAGQDCGNEIGV